MCRFSNGRLVPDGISAFRFVGDFDPVAAARQDRQTHSARPTRPAQLLFEVPSSFPAASDLVVCPLAKKAKTRVVVLPEQQSSSPNPSITSSFTSNAAMSPTPGSPHNQHEHEHDIDDDHEAEPDDEDVHMGTTQPLRYSLATFKIDGTDRRHTYATGSRRDPPAGFESVSNTTEGVWLFIEKMDPSKRDHTLFIDEANILRRYYGERAELLSDAYAAGILVFWPLSSLRICARKCRLTNEAHSRSARFATCTPTGTVHVQYAGPGPLSYSRFSEIRQMLNVVNQEYDHSDFGSQDLCGQVPNLDELRVYARHVKSCLPADQQRVHFPSTVASMTTAQLHHSLASVRNSTLSST